MIALRCRMLADGPNEQAIGLKTKEYALGDAPESSWPRKWSQTTHRHLVLENPRLVTHLDRLERGRRRRNCRVKGRMLPPCAPREAHDQVRSTDTATARGGILWGGWSLEKHCVR